jgi:hypothetical protein
MCVGFAIGDLIDFSAAGKFRTRHRVRTRERGRRARGWLRSTRRGRCTGRAKQASADIFTARCQLAELPDELQKVAIRERGLGREPESTCAEPDRKAEQSCDEIVGGLLEREAVTDAFSVERKSAPAGALVQLESRCPLLAHFAFAVCQVGRPTRFVRPQRGLG